MLHKVSLKCRQAPGTDAASVESRIDSWASNYPVPDDYETRIEYRDNFPPGADLQPHLACRFTFEISDSRRALLASLEDALQGSVAWYRIKYHACYHDEEYDMECRWTDELDWGTVPEGVQ